MIDFPPAFSHFEPPWFFGTSIRTRRLYILLYLGIVSLGVVASRQNLVRIQMSTRSISQLIGFVRTSKASSRKHIVLVICGHAAPHLCHPSQEDARTSINAEVPSCRTGKNSSPDTHYHERQGCNKRGTRRPSRCSATHSMPCGGIAQGIVELSAQTELLREVIVKAVGWGRKKGHMLVGWSWETESCGFYSEYCAYKQNGWVSPTSKRRPKRFWATWSYAAQHDKSHKNCN